MTLLSRSGFTLHGVTLFALSAGLLGLSCMVNQVAFVGSFYGWCAYGALAVAALLAAAWNADSWAVLPAGLVALTLTSTYAFPYAFGLPIFAAAFVLARSVRGDSAKSVGRWLLVSVGLVFAYVVIRWIHGAVLPAMERCESANRIAGEVWLRDMPWPRLLMPLGHANYTSGIGVIFAPIFAAMALRENERAAWRAVWIVFAGLAAVLIVGGGSRAALLAPGVAVAAWILFAPATVIPTKVKVALVAAGTALTAAVAAIHPHFRDWFSNPESIAYSDLIRRDYVEGCRAMFLEKPVIGWGAGAMPANFAPFNPPRAEYVSCYHAHTTPIQWAVEFGVMGGVLFAAIAGLCAVALRRVSRLAREDMPVATGLVVAATGYTVFSLFDYQTNIPALGAAWGVVLGGVSLVVLPGEFRASGVWMQKISRLILIGCAAYATLLVVTGVSARRGVLFAKESLGNDITLASRYMADATGSAPENAAMHGYAAVVYDRFAKAKKSVAVAELVDREWELAALAEPNFPQLKTYRALMLSPTDPQKAATLFKESLRVGPKFPAAWRGLAECYFHRNDREAVATVIALSLFVRPENAFDPALQSGAFGVTTGEILRRFDTLVGEYSREFPADRFALRELAKVQKQTREWYAAGSPMDFVRTHPDWSTKPAWLLLAKHLPTSPTQPFDRDRATCALKATVFASQEYTMNSAQAGVLLDQYLGRPIDPFSGIRVVQTPEVLFHFSSYLGVSDLIDIGFPSHAREDLLANLLLYEGAPIRLRADKRFLLLRLDRLP